MADPVLVLVPPLIRHSESIESRPALSFRDIDATGIDNRGQIDNGESSVFLDIATKTITHNEPGTEQADGGSNWSGGNFKSSGLVTWAKISPRRPEPEKKPEN